MNTSGLVNLGNTCYINSILQCLVNNKRFIMTIIKNYESKNLKYNKQKYSDFLDCFIVLSREMYLDEMILRPTTFKKVLAYNKPHYNNKIQHDSEELFLDILDMLYESTSIEKNNIENKNYSKYIISSKNQWNLYFTKDSFVLDEYYGQYSCKYTCNICDEIFYDFVPFCSIYLNLPTYDTDITTLIRNYFEKDYKNIKCRKDCNKDRDQDDLLTPEHLIETNIFKLPNTLVFVLKRYTKNRAKNKVGVYINDILDLSDYYPTNYNTNESVVYKISSVINNKGDTIMSGHYTTTIYKNENNYIEYDDAKINNVESFDKNDCYMLFYEKLLM